MFGCGLALIAGGSPVFIFNYTVSADGTNLNIRSAAVAAGWDQVKPLLATITINSGIYLGSGSISAYALDTDATAWPSGSDVLVVNNGFIVGMGGAGNGGSGGPAVRVQSGCPIRFDNTSGTIGGGGGGGGFGQAAQYFDGKTSPVWNGGGGGGGGRGFNGGAAGGPYNPAPMNLSGGTGGAGSKTSAGGGASGGYTSAGAYGGAGGNGGGLGANGSSGGGGLSNNGGYSGPGGGGSAGAAIVGNANITWIATGTRLGSIS